MASGDTKTETLLKALENGGEIDEIVGCCNTKMQDYILDNIDAVNSAKEAITNKGGTVGDTGLAGLAEEIETIPSGGGPEDWGTVTYRAAGASEDTTVTIQNAYEYSTLCSSEYTIPVIDGVTIQVGLIKEVKLGKNATFTGTEFLRSATNLVKLEGSENLQKIGYGFLFGCTSFNQELDLSNVEEIGDQFLHGCTSYNQPIDVSNSNLLGGYFMSGCTSFNSTVTLPDDLAAIPYNFMTGCSWYNQPLNIPSSVENIGNSFLQSCTAFSQPITLPSGLRNIGDSFLQGCTAFSQTLTIPANVVNIGRYFMYNCDSFTSLVCNGGSSLPTSNQTLATQNASAAMYTTGVTLTGTNASSWKNRYADRTSSPYRKLIVSS